MLDLFTADGASVSVFFRALIMAKQIFQDSVQILKRKVVRASRQPRDKRQWTDADERQENNERVWDCIKIGDEYIYMQNWCCILGLYFRGLYKKDNEMVLL